MHITSFPDLTYEEYLHAVAHLACRIQRMTDIGSVAIDQLIVKWYIINVLHYSPKDKKQIASMHLKYIGAIQKMIADGLITILETQTIGKQSFRALHVHPQLCSTALWISVMNENEIKLTEKTD